MDRTAYLETVAGQRSERRKRFLQRQLLFVRSHEPKSKKGITPQEGVAFQRQIKSQMADTHRRAYRSHVVLEADFFSEQNDPPALHTLAKCYMDLLQEPIAGSAIADRRLLLADDRHIDVLIVNYHLRRGSEPEVRLQIDRVANFVQDLFLLHRIQYRDFSDVGDYDTSNWVDDQAEQLWSRSHDAIDTLRDWRGRRSQIISAWGEPAFDGIDRINLIKVQEEYLNIVEPKVRDLLTLLQPTLGPLGLKSQLPTQLRDLIVQNPLMVDLGHMPVVGEGKGAFKQRVEIAITQFKKNHAILFPLLTTVGVSIFCVPPAIHSVSGQENYADLDNLARYIIPAVHEVIAPPADTVHTFDVATIRDERLWIEFIERQDRLKRTPKHSVTRYQMVRMPRLAGDPPDGIVRLTLSSGDSYNSTWRQLDRAIRPWEGH